MDIKHYSPIYWLGALGFGGVMVTFFLLLHVNVPHPDTAIPTAIGIKKFLNMDGGGLQKVAVGMMAKKAIAKKQAAMHGQELAPEVITGIKQKVAQNKQKVAALVSKLKIQQAVAYIGLGGMLIAIILHFRLLFWNISKYWQFKKTEQFRQLKDSIKEVQLMAIPLTLAMSVKVYILGGSVFIDGFYGPLNMWITFFLYLAVGVYAIYIFGEYFGRILDEGSSEFITNNNLSQMLAIFAFAMISGGLMGPAAFSSDPMLSKWSFMIALAFGAVSLLFAFIKFGNSMAPIFSRGVSATGSVSILIIVPILTLFGVWGVLRAEHGLHHAFHSSLGYTWMISMLTIIFALEVTFMLMGLRAMKKKDYFKRFIFGDDEHDPSAFAIICPFVAFYVWGMFWLHAGLVKSGMLDKWGMLYLVLFGFFTLVQIVLLVFYFRLNKKLLGKTLLAGKLTTKEVNIVEKSGDQRF